MGDGSRPREGAEWLPAGTGVGQGQKRLCRVGAKLRNAAGGAKDIEYLFTYLLFIHISSFMSFSSQIFCPCFYGAVCLLLHFLLQPTPVVLLGKSHGQRSVVGYSPWGCKESDVSEQLHFHLTVLSIHLIPFSSLQSLSRVQLFATP